MEEKDKDLENFEKIKIKGLDDIEEVKEEEIIGSINTLDEELIKENLSNSNKKDIGESVNAVNYIRLVSENQMELDEKDNLIEVFNEINGVLNESKNKPKSINEIYEKYLGNKFITKNHIKKDIGDCLLKFILFVIGPIFGIIFLIGIFQMKSLMKALGDLISTSFSDYYHCYFLNSNCNVTSFNNENSVYDFYDYYYNVSKNETIDFNLMILTGFVGSLLLGWVGFRFSVFILSAFNFGSIVWLLNLDFEFKAEVVFILKILNFCFIYVLLLIGIGGSALLSHQILIESHLKYKKYLKDKREEEERAKEEEKKKEEINNLYMIDLNLDKKSGLQRSSDFSLKNNKLLDEKKKEINPTKTILTTKKSKDLAIKIARDQLKQKVKEERLDKRDKNKFDFFFMICLTTIIGYLGKYSINILLDFILSIIFNTKNYDKKYFMVSLLILYGLSLIVSLVFYMVFKYSIFENDEKQNNNENEKIIKISEICGYIIYSEKKKPKKPPKRNCCTLLCCENTQNCCETTFCNLFQGWDICDLNPHCPQCCCNDCKYDPDDYNKDQEDFRYCYKAQRKSFWCNKFMANKTQKKIFPKMIQYFILQLTTIGFEKQYEKYKNQNDDIIIWVAVFISTFALFFYLTLSFTRIFFNENEVKVDDDNEFIFENRKNKKTDKGPKKKELISKLSNEILNGTYGILVFNGIFSLIFSIFYLSNISKEIKTFFFEDYSNIIFMPILMNKFYYFTLSYYSIYTSEKDNKFDIISASSLISIYVALWGMIISVIKSFIPDSNSSDDYNYYNILFIIQIVSSSFPVFIVIVFIVAGICFSTGFIAYLEYDFDCDECKNNFALHKFLGWLCSCIFCFGGLWIRMTDFQKYKIECCDVGEYCDISGNCCNVYCIDNIMFCDCCFCEHGSCCFSKCCDVHCNSCKVCECCGLYYINN